MKSVSILRRARVNESWYSLTLAQGRDWEVLAKETENDQIKKSQQHIQI